MSQKPVEATAPCRVDLTGGDLGVWPVYLFHPGAVVVNVAIDRRVWCRAEPDPDGVQIESKDALLKMGGETVSELLGGGGPLSPLAHVLDVLGVETGLRLVTQSRVPAGSGLGGAAALRVAVAAAVSRALGKSVDPDRLSPLLRDAQTRASAAPGGAPDHEAALRGGVVAAHLEPGEIHIESLAVDPARVEESLLLIDSGGASTSPSRWTLVQGQLDGSARVREVLAILARVARGLYEALVGGRFDDIVGLFAEEWEARSRLVPDLSTPDIDRIVELSRAAGGAAKPCGAGRGRVVAVWAPPGARGPGRREAVEGTLTEAGFRVFPARVDLRGLELD